MSYYRNTYLKSDHWQNLRLEKLVKTSARCHFCKKESISNDIHHIKYKRLYDVTNKLLRVLCRDCHDLVHAVMEANPDILKEKSANTRWGRVEEIVRGILKVMAPELKILPLHVCDLESVELRSIKTKLGWAICREFKIARKWLHLNGHLTTDSSIFKAQMPFRTAYIRWRLKIKGPIHPMQWLMRAFESGDYFDVSTAEKPTCFCI